MTRKIISQTLVILALVNALPWALYFWIGFCWNLSSGHMWGAVLCITGIVSVCVLILAAADAFRGLGKGEA